MPVAKCFIYCTLLFQFEVHHCVVNLLISMRYLIDKAFQNVTALSTLTAEFASQISSSGDCGLRFDRCFMHSLKNAHQACYPRASVSLIGVYVTR